jgi:hypothetical protein
MDSWSSHIIFLCGYNKVLNMNIFLSTKFSVVWSKLFSKLLNKKKSKAHILLLVVWRQNNYCCMFTITNQSDMDSDTAVYYSIFQSVHFIFRGLVILMVMFINADNFIFAFCICWQNQIVAGLHTRYCGKKNVQEVYLLWVKIAESNYNRNVFFVFFW